MHFCYGTLGCCWYMLDVFEPSVKCCGSGDGSSAQSQFFSFFFFFSSPKNGNQSCHMWLNGWGDITPGEFGWDCSSL